MVRPFPLHRGQLRAEAKSLGPSFFATIAVSRAAERAKKAEERLKEQLEEERGKGLLGRLKD